MLGARFRQAVQAVASASTSSRPLHTSSVLHAKRAATVIRKENILKQAKRAKEELSDRPSVVLGTRPSEEATKWPNCLLAKVIVDEEALFRGDIPPPPPVNPSTLNLNEAPEIPKNLAFGVGEEEKEILFNTLPSLSVDATLAPGTGRLGTGTHLVSEQRREEARKRELLKVQHLSRVVDLRNTNAAGLAFENRRRIILAFSTPENPFDPGRAEVQAALKTYQIRKLWKHLTTFRRDVGNRLGLRKLVHERAKILRYLRNKNRDRYETLLEQLALEPEAVEGELVV
ncbi:hypothetical protein CC1G_05321 [Coprinopsis cinerea okayama7|uniref:Ribosomal protein S15 n=1 Tax=Coprinopsis cinerea (strain Okayama-7 / 130 / ATCC MYA-4618 / FGSC 9003) TaxID=240176 RepID=A8PCM5_COPC7|nr:hypothetical protein CC1G_05321 [Coprinopsis cinerea okayama7\|eukprot:XP_001840435.1 hypothetical protein CC1G_05321 [Coprinopsis cinerea okayama7\